MDGYMWLEITPGEGTCGVQMQPSFPNVYFDDSLNIGLMLAIATIGLLSPVYGLCKLRSATKSGEINLNEGVLKLKYPLFAQIVIYLAIVTLFMFGLLSKTP